MSTCDTMVYRIPRVEDAADVYELIKSSPPLDLNSRYCYLLHCSHFANTSCVAEEAGKIVGFLSAYRKPAALDTLFVWQISVHKDYRGQGTARSMILEILERKEAPPFKFVEATVTRSNRASFALFESATNTLCAPCVRSLLFRQEDFGSSGHEEEVLLRIGPLP